MKVFFCTSLRKKKQLTLYLHPYLTIFSRSLSVALRVYACMCVCACLSVWLRNAFACVDDDDDEQEEGEEENNETKKVALLLLHAHTHTTYILNIHFDSSRLSSVCLQSFVIALSNSNWLRQNEHHIDSIPIPDGSEMIKDID